MTRRKFLISSSVALAGAVVCAENALGSTKGRIQFGVCRPLNDAEKLKSVGYDFIECDVSSALQPMKGEDAWKRQQDCIASLALPLRACNCLVPGSFRLTGPGANHAPALDYVEKVVRRAGQVGVKYLVFGSGGARNVPGDHLTKMKPDVEKGVGQFVEFCRALSKRISDVKDVTVVIEPLRPNESNIINYVWQAAQVCNDINSPKIMALADFYHMMMGRESAESLLKAGLLIKHCHIAEFRSRSFPGANTRLNEMYEPYFNALKAIDYDGGVSCECGWGAGKDLMKNLEKSLALMHSLAL